MDVDQASCPALMRVDSSGPIFRLWLSVSLSLSLCVCMYLELSI